MLDPEDVRYQKAEENEAERLHLFSEHEADLSRWELSFDEIIIWIEHLLRGERLDTENKRWEKKRDPYMNEKGIQHICTELAARLNKNTYLSNYSIEDARYRAWMFANTLISDIAMKQQEWELRKKDFDTVLHMIIDVNDHALHRAVGGLEREQRLTVQRTVENVSTFRGQERKTGGMFSFLNPFGKKKEENVYGKD
jgi:hypothetical protein